MTTENLGQIVDAEIPSQGLTPRPDLKLLSPNDLFERFLRLSVAQGNASLRTLATYREGIRIYFSWANSVGIDPKTATFDHIEEFRKYISGKCRPSTVKLRLRCVRILYQAMQRWGIRNDNPADGVKAPADRTSQTDRAMSKALTPEEASKLWERTRGYTTLARRDRAMIGLMLWQGLRAQEIANLSLNSVDYLSLTYIDVDGKGNKIRRVTLSEPAREALLSYLRDRERDSLTAPLFPDANNFLGMDSRKLSVRKVERIIDRYLIACSLKKPGRSAHALRHTYAVLSVLGGAQREVLAETMGHGNLSTTDIYLRAAARLQENPADKAWAFAEKQKELKRNADLKTVAG